MRQACFWNLAPKAMPTAIASPCPSDPVLASTPGTLLPSRCMPNGDLKWLNSLRSSLS